ncbi:MAG: hypothetical protein AB1633_05070 [Elusimicrobiota bacterium]
MVSLLMKLLPLGVVGFIGYKGYGQAATFINTAIHSVEINATKMELANFITMIAIEHQSGNGFPSDFKAFVCARFQKPDNSFKEIWQDVWLNDYNYIYHEHGCRISSNGPDSIAGTRDDVFQRYGKY